MRLENFENRCDTCKFTFAICGAKSLLFASECVSIPDGVLADTVLWCDSYVHRVDENKEIEAE